MDSEEFPAPHETAAADPSAAPTSGPITAPASPVAAPRWYRRRSSIIAGSVAAALLIAGSGAGIGLGLSGLVGSSGLGSAGLGSPGQSSPGQSSTGQSNTPESGGQSTQSLPPRGYGRGGSSFQRASAADAVPATAAQTVGVVTIVSTLDYNANSQAAGTGMILSSNGLILTNNHVIENSTSIKVTVESTGKTYTATVVGTDATDDVAVLKLTDATGLTAIHFATGSAVATGASVTAVGNAGGTGDLVAATGTVTTTGKSITVQGDSTDTSESLTDLIEVSADIVAGDSGGPLLNSAGAVIGIDTAASAGSANTVGYAIPITKALTIARQIEAGTASATVKIGYPAFLGVQLASPTLSGGSAGTDGPATVGGVIAGTPAETLGLVAGDTITAIDGVAVGSPSALSAAISAHMSGDRVAVSWTDASGAPHTATAALANGPAL
jgi:S1-C subfamily serine protease